MTTGYAEVDGARLYYETAGTGYPLVWVHAGVADCRMWDPQFGPFAGRYRVARYDARGFGRSPMPDGPFTPSRDLAGVLDTLGMARAHLVGASMGAVGVIDLALTAPERVGALVLVSPAVAGHRWSEAVRRFGAAEDAALERGDVEAAVELNVRMWVDGPRRSPEQVDPVLRKQVWDMQRHAFGLPAGDGIPQVVEPPAITRLGDIAAPTLAIIGAEDVEDFHTLGGLLARQIPGARQAVLPGAAHMVSLERPAEFNRLVMDFLAEHTPA